MPDKDKKDEIPTPPAPATPEFAAGVAEAERQAEARKQDETIPGGRFIVNGVLVNASGQPIDENGKVQE